MYCRCSVNVCGNEGNSNKWFSSIYGNYICMDRKSQRIFKILKKITHLLFPVFLHVVQDSKIQLPIIQLRKVWAEAVHYVSGLKEDYSRLFQGQRAAM